MKNQQIPNWQNAPSWAQYWAVDLDGRAYWYENEPEPMFDLFCANICGWYNNNNGINKYDLDSENNTVPDWTKTLQTRPKQADKGPTVQPEYYKVGKGRNMHTGWPDSGF